MGIRYIYTMEYLSFVYKSGITKYAGKWMKLENNIPNEVTWAPKGKSHMSSLISGS